MKIGTLGTGRMCSTLGRLFSEHGHQLFFGSREPEKAQHLAAEIGRDCLAGSYTQAAAFCDILLLGVPWQAALETLENIGAPQGSLSGKVLIDMTNPVQPEGGLETLGSTSAAEQIALLSPGASVIKAFNSIHYANIAEPILAGQNASMFYCGSDPAAKANVHILAAEIGLDPVDCGSLNMARYLEPLAYLWMHLAFREGLGTGVAIKLLRR